LTALGAVNRSTRFCPWFGLFESGCDLLHHFRRR
jgi:hypothetical protein